MEEGNDARRFVEEAEEIEAEEDISEDLRWKSDDEEWTC